MSTSEWYSVITLEIFIKCSNCFIFFSWGWSQILLVPICCYEETMQLIVPQAQTLLCPWHTIRQNVECDKLDGKSYHVPYHPNFVVWSRMELEGTHTDPYDVISSLLEKDNITRAHCFKNEKSIWTINYNSNYNDAKELSWWY